MKQLIGYFLKGVLVVVPIGLTVYVIWHSIVWIDALLPFQQRGLGLIAVLVSLTVIGYLASAYLTSSLFLYLEKLFAKVPIVKIVYLATKDFIAAFVGEKKKFNQPVLVRLNDENQLFRIGFITADNLGKLGIEDKVGVYFPSSYSVLGTLYIVPTKNITPLDAKGADVMKFIMSGGVSDL
jgi:uncharacterized membrane protein